MYSQSQLAIKGESIVFRFADGQTSNFFTQRNDAGPARGNPYKILLNVSRMNDRRHFFTERIGS